ncbi:MAG TPA: hypothetical protein VJ765_09300 [Chitinophagaceae bacterium]|nr:hypothetical protein [Chitinophagaceae bacterium]
MKLLFLFCFIALFGLFGSNLKKPVISVAEKLTIILKDTIDFTSQVQPILVKNCSPCHFSGGKMYEKMPFDKDTTIINHEKGILKRIKGDENLVLKTFIEQNKNGPFQDEPH